MGRLYDPADFALIPYAIAVIGDLSPDADDRHKLHLARELVEEIMVGYFCHHVQAGDEARAGGATAGFLDQFSDDDRIAFAGCMERLAADPLRRESMRAHLSLLHGHDRNVVEWLLDYAAGIVSG